MTENIKGSEGGYLIGNSHKEGGIPVKVKSEGLIEVEGGEIIITKPAVEDPTKRRFEGSKMTNREILSAINVSGGGVAFADGGEIPEIKTTGKFYEFEGNQYRDFEIVHGCGCKHKLAHGGSVILKDNKEEELELTPYEEDILERLQIHPKNCFLIKHADSKNLKTLINNNIIQCVPQKGGIEKKCLLILVDARRKKFAEGGTILSKVQANQELLKAMTTAKQLRDWAISNNMDNQAAFPKFKKALNNIGMNYDDIKQGKIKADAEKLKSTITHEVTFYCDAKASAGRFGITDGDGNILWHGRFFENENANEQSDAELEAAKKAVWLASKVKEAINAPAIRLNLIIDAQWLIYQDHAGQKGYALTQAANKYNIQLNVKWVSGKKNPADEWTVASGYKKWSDNNLAALAMPIKSEQEIEDIKEVYEAEKGNQKPIEITGNLIELPFCKIVNESDSAIEINLKIKGNKEDIISIWFPKSVSKIENNKLYITEKFWETKKKELINKYGLVSITNFTKLYDKEKTIGIGVRLYEYITEQSISTVIWFPKSQTISYDNQEVVVTNWIWTKKQEETIDEVSESFRRVTSIDVFTDVILPEFISCDNDSVISEPEPEPEIEKLSLIQQLIQSDIPELQADAGHKPEHNYVYFKGITEHYANAFELNKAIEEFLDANGKDYDYNIEEKQFLQYYSGYGGLIEFGAKDTTGILYEYFTPSKIAERMWGLAYKYGFKGGNVLEPSVGIGEFVKYAPVQDRVDCYEINKYSAMICKILYPKATVNLKSFEDLFIKNNSTIKNKTKDLKKYSLVIGNPPYGEYNSLSAGMGEKDYTKARNYIDYFISRGLDLLEPNGLLIFIIGAQVSAGAVMWLDQDMNSAKEMIADKSEILDAYRLPNGVFERTDVLSDIIVLRKK